MTFTVAHEQIREVEDRSWTFALVDVVRSSSASAAERDEALGTLAHLEDYRSIGPLTAMLEEHDLPDSIREAASRVLLGFDDSTTGERRRGWWEHGDPVAMAHALGLMERSEADVIVAVAGDDRHSLQRLALAGTAFGLDEAKYQSVKIRALAHPDADVREAAADVLMWDEPVTAEGPLVRAASDPAGTVAAAAVATLKYYPSRRVLRALAELAKTTDGPTHAEAAESFDHSRSRFEDRATYGDPEQVTLLREWMAPVADLVRWPADVQDRKPYSAPADRSRIAMTESDLLALVADPDGAWGPKKQTLRHVAWEGYGTGERGRLATALATHPDPVVRQVATKALTAWSRSAELLGLAADSCFLVRKSAWYCLGMVPRDSALAEPAWEYMLAAGGTTAYEALRTYVAHASAREAKERLVALAQIDGRESIRTQAISCLADLGAVGELESLVPLLREPPGVSWGVHIEIIDGLRTLGLPAPDLDDLAAVDHLELMRSVVALRCATQNSDGSTGGSRPRCT